MPFSLKKIPTIGTIKASKNRRDCVMSRSLRLLEEQELRVQRLQEALIAGENSGSPQPFDRELLKQEIFSCAEVIRILHQSMDTERHLQDN
jgi:hypothetical protein